MTTATYLLKGQPSELDRLQLQSRVWEPAGQRLLDQLGSGDGARVIDVGCGALGWLRLLSDWVGPDGEVVGTDIDDTMLNAAGQFVESHRLSNVTLVRDDLFASQLELSTFDLVHARFLLGPLGRVHEQLTAYLRLVRPGGTLVSEKLDYISWHFVPTAPSIDVDSPPDRQLLYLVREAFRRAGGEHETFAAQLAAFRTAGIEPDVRAEIEVLPPGHPYASLPIQFATALAGVIRTFVDPEELEAIVERATDALDDPNRWGLTFTLTQCWATGWHDDPRVHASAADR
jgi:ubiquinone/menaquinone biosynthesis C-methylase UbiE